MLGDTTLPKGPVYNPKAEVKYFMIHEQFDIISLIHSKDGTLYQDAIPLEDLGKTIEWKRPKQICKRPYFVKDNKPSRFDALQGGVLDCWLITAMEGLTFHEEIFQFVVPSGQSFDRKYIGAFHFRFWQLGTWYDVVVDDRLPVYQGTDELVFARSRSGDVFWAALLEKAYIKLNGEKLRGYDSLEMGYAVTAFQDLTGGIPEFIRTGKPPAGRPLRWYIKELFWKRSLGACVIEDRPLSNSGLRASHTYLITGVFYNKDNDPDYPGLCLIRLLNPWGDTEWTGDYNDDDEDNWNNIKENFIKDMEWKSEEEGEFWIRENDFLTYFTFIYVCHMGPYHYLYCHTASRVLSWSTKTFRGEWVTGISAGGSIDYNRHINPQFKVTINPPDNRPARQKASAVTVVIDLVHRSFLDRTFCPRIGFFVYSIIDPQDWQTSHLNQSFFDNNKPVKPMDLRKSEGRAYAEFFSIKPGNYLIVPCTENAGEDSSFLIRIFTESDVDYWVDDTISKSSPIEEEPIEMINYEELKHVFDEVAHNEEVDWIDLKHLLEKCLNTSEYNGTLYSVFKRSSHAIAKKLSINLINDHIAFSKNECRSMIAIFDYDNTGKLNYHEFCSLWKKINFWHKVYNSFRDSEGSMKVEKLSDALGSIGYNLNKRIVHRLVYLYSNEQGQIVLMDFILCGVILENFFVRYGKAKLNVSLELSLEEWVKLILAV